MIQSQFLHCSQSFPGSLAVLRPHQETVVNLPGSALMAEEAHSEKMIEISGRERSLRMWTWRTRLSSSFVGVIRKIKSFFLKIYHCLA